MTNTSSELHLNMNTPCYRASDSFLFLWRSKCCAQRCLKKGFTASTPWRLSRDTLSWPQTLSVNKQLPSKHVMTATVAKRCLNISVWFEFEHKNPKPAFEESHDSRAQNKEGTHPQVVSGGLFTQPLKLTDTTELNIEEVFADLYSPKSTSSRQRHTGNT